MVDSDSENGDEKKELDLSSSDVVTKYKAAAEISNKAVAAIVALIKDGARIVELAKLGDSTINQEVAKSFKGKNMEKGVAFPTCVSVNHIVGHFSPLSDDTATLKEGDLVKIDLGVHIDGFIATQATTVVVAADAAAPVTGRAADAIAAARMAYEAAQRLIRPGKKVSEVSAVLNKIVEAYGCTLVEGVMTHQLKQFVIDGSKCVLNRPTPEHKVEDAEFEENEVYAIDIVVSSGEGKPKINDEKDTTVYKRALEITYNLKMKTSRAVFSEITSKFPTMPFTLRALVTSPESTAAAAAKPAAGKDKEVSAVQLRLGMVECLNHGLLHGYPVLHEKPGEFVAQFKGTVLLMPNGSDVVTKAPASQTITSEKRCDDAEVAALLATSLKKSKPKKKKASKGEETAVEAE
ncbi:MAG: hypothetical protein WDW38_004395 [Sanguina aurantia]